MHQANNYVHYIIKTMTNRLVENKFSSLYLLQQKGGQHIALKRYSWAMVYLTDALKDFETEIDRVSDSDEMEKLIREVKVPCHKNLSLSYLKQGNYEGCIQQCKGVLEVQPHNAQILYRLGLCYLNIYNLGEAETYLRQASFLDPTDKEVMKALNRIEELSFSPLKNRKTSLSIGL